jgi:hypothetical protein
MAILVSPSVLRSAARLTSRIGEIGGVAGDNPWKGAYRVAGEPGRLRLISTDGLLTLDWSMPAEGPDLDDFGAIIEASGFDALASRLADGDPYEIARGEGLVLTQSGPSPSRPQGGTSRLRLPGRAAPAHPPRSLAGPDIPGRPSHSWTAPAEPLARALAFVAPFIGTKNPLESRSVATWTTEGVLVGGSPMKAALVSGLPRSLTPLSFGRRMALTTAAFLEQVRNDVEVRAVGSHYSFTSATDGHVLELRGEPASFPMQFLRLDDTPLERYSIDRKALLNSLAILEVFLPSRGDNLEFHIRGEGEDAAIRISTPGSPATRSSDEFPIIRSARSPASQPDAPGRRAAETLFWAKGRLMQQVLNMMGSVTVTCDFDPRNRRVRLAEAPRPGEMVRSFNLSVLIPPEEDEPDRPSSGSDQAPAAGPGRERPTGVAVDDPLDMASERGGGSGGEHRPEARPA